MELAVVALVLLACLAFLIRRAIGVARGECSGCGALGRCPGATDLADELKRALAEMPEEPQSEPPAAILR